MAEPKPLGAPSLSRRVAAGALWSGGASAAVQLTSIVAYGVVAWYLGPEELGTAALALAVVEAARMLQSFGLAPAIVSGRVSEPLVVLSAHWLICAIGIALAALVAAMAPAAASFFHNPAVAPLLATGALLPAIDGFAVVPLALLQQHQRFDRIAAIETATQLGVGVGAVALVANGYGIWSLVLPQITGRLVRAAAIWRLAPMCYSLSFSAAALRLHLAECGHLTGAAAAHYVLHNSDKLVVGRFFGASDLGRYHFAYSCLARALTVLSHGVSLPLMASLGKLRNEPERFGRAVVRAVRTVARITFPLTLGGALLAPQIVSLVFGERWLDTGTLIRCFLSLAAVQSVGALFSPVWLALGRTRLVLQWGLTANVSVTFAFLFGAWLGSVEYVALSFALYSTFVLGPATLWVTRRVCGIPLDGLMRGLGVVLLDSLCMLAGVAALGSLGEAAALPMGFLLCLQIAIGGLLYLAILRGFHRSELLELLELLPGRVGELLGRLLATRATGSEPARSH